MKMQRLAVTLTTVNLVLLLLAAGQAASTAQEDVDPILRGRALVARRAATAERPNTTSITLKDDGGQNVITPKTVPRSRGE